MSIDAAVLDALLAAGASAEMIVAAVKADAAKEEARRQEKRRKDADRKRRSRAVSAMSRGHCVTDAESGGQVVTACDPSPEERVSPTPPSETQPSTIPPSPPKGGSSPTTDEPDEIELAVSAYNSMAIDAAWPKVQKLTDARRAALRRRLVDCGGVEGWREAMARARGSPFLTGDNDRGWRADFDFFLQAKSFTRLMEGAYDRRDSTPGAAGRPTRGPSGAGKIVSEMADIVLGSAEPGFPPASAGKPRPDGGPEESGSGEVLPFGRALSPRVR